MALQEVRRYNRNFKVWYCGYTNMTFLAHWHEEMEFIFVRSGSAVVYLDNQRYVMEAGDILLCPSGSIHYCDSSERKNHLEFVLFDVSLIQSRLSPLQMAPLYLSRQRLEELDIKKDVQNVFDKLPKELQEGAPYYEEIVKSTLRMLCYKLQRLFSHSGTPSGAACSARLTSEEILIQQTLQYLAIHISEETSLETAAQQVNLSACYLSRIFKKYTGTNFVKYRNLLRVEQAIDLLQNTSHPVSEIAYECGFQDIRTLNRVFRQYTAHTPSEFRKDPSLGNYVVSYPHRQSQHYLLVENDSPVVTQNPH